MRAWHILEDTGLLRDNTPPPPDGEWLEYEGPIRICRSGLHASARVTDALKFAPGSIVCRVDMADACGTEPDKLVARRRKIIWRIDAEQVFRKFARLCALDVIHLWDAPSVVLRYLRTGDSSIRDAAWDAAGDAARDAAGDAAKHAAWAAVRATTRDADTDTVVGVARTAAWDAKTAAWDARTAVGYVARDAAGDAFGDASWDVGWNATGTATKNTNKNAVMDAAWNNAMDASEERQTRRLERMLHEEHRRIAS